jgi:hypothetical protein
MEKTRLWFARLVMLYALLIFSFLAYLYIFEPLRHIEQFGISAEAAPEAINFLRVGPGGLFLGMAITALYGLVRPSKMIMCLAFIVLFDGCIVVLRLYGIAIDGVTPVQLTELRDEGVSWLFFVAALVAHPRKHLRADNG